jgi:hypothetical protein
MNTKELEAATVLLKHYRQRKGELGQLHDVGNVLHSVKLTFGGAGDTITISLHAEISDTESLRIQILDQLARLVSESAEATCDHLADMGVEI